MGWQAFYQRVGWTGDTHTKAGAARIDAALD
jgi:hypothetical protein